MLAAALWMALCACEDNFDEPDEAAPPKTTSVAWMEWAETTGEPTRLVLWDVDVFGEPVVVGRLYDPPAAPWWDGRGWRFAHVQDGWEDGTGCVRRILWITAPDLYWSTAPRDRIADLIEFEPPVRMQIRIW